MIGPTYGLKIVRGLPGSGKSTIGKQLASPDPGHMLTHGRACFAADDWMVDRDGLYSFNPEKLKYCHEQCQSQVYESLDNEIVRAHRLDNLFDPTNYVVVVANTFTEQWEIDPYLEIIEQLQAEHNVRVRLTVMTVDNGLSDEELAARNTHGVPVAAIKRMRDRFQHNINTRGLG